MVESLSLCQIGSAHVNGTARMAMLPSSVEAVIGADTRDDNHRACLVNSICGELAAIIITADADGYAHLIGWTAHDMTRPNVVWAIEGIRGHCAGLTRALRVTGQRQSTPIGPRHVSRRASGESDVLDASRACPRSLGSRAERHTSGMARGRRTRAAGHRR
ncbi:hypothetical protein ACWEJ6_43425 [Nonomuraea sp. NPDC004702]